MARQQKIGNLGEDTANHFLISLGYLILERNWRFKKAEIDIIAKDKEVLVFVEVKAKTYTHFGQPEESITARKESLIVDAAGQYMDQIGHQWEVRFDIISIVFDQNLQPSIHHFKDAFYPTI